MKIKKIGAILAGAVMIGSAVAAAWDPVENRDFFIDPVTGEPNAIIVVGASAAAEDVTGAAWIAAQIGSMAYYEEEICPVDSDIAQTLDDYGPYWPTMLVVPETAGWGPVTSAPWFELDSLKYTDVNENESLDCDEPTEFIAMNLSEDGGGYPYLPGFNPAVYPFGLVYGSLSNVSERCCLTVQAGGECPTCETKEAAIFYFPDEYNNMHIWGRDYTTLDTFKIDGKDEEAIVFGEPYMYTNQEFVIGSHYSYPGGWEITVTDISILGVIPAVEVEIVNTDLGFKETKHINVDQGEGLVYGELFFHNIDLLGPEDWEFVYCCKCDLYEGYLTTYTTDPGCIVEPPLGTPPDVSPNDYFGTTDFAIIPSMIWQGQSGTNKVTMDVYTVVDPWALEDMCCLQPCNNDDWWNLRVKNWGSVYDYYFDGDFGKYSMYYNLMGGNRCGQSYYGCEGEVLPSMNEVDIVHKEGAPDWNVIDDPENGTLTYFLTSDGMLAYNYDNPLPNYELVVIMAETSGGSEWPQTGSISLTGESGVADISNQLGLVNDGVDYDGSVFGAKIWYVHESLFDEVGGYFVEWDLDGMLFEVDLIFPYPYYVGSYGEAPYDVGVFLTLQTPHGVEEGLPCEVGEGVVHVPFCQLPNDWEVWDVEEYWQSNDPEYPYFEVTIDDSDDNHHNDWKVSDGITVWQDIHQPCYTIKHPVQINFMDIVKEDLLVTTADKAMKNLILIGGPGLVLQANGKELPCNLLSKEIVDAEGSEIDWVHSLGDYEYLEDVFTVGKDVIIVAGAEREQTRNAVIKLLEDMEA